MYRKAFTTYQPDVLKAASLGDIFENHPSPAVHVLDGSGPNSCKIRKLQFSKLTGNMLLDVRLVCRQWRTEIDQYLAQTKSVKLFANHTDLRTYVNLTTQAFHSHETKQFFKLSTSSLEDLEVIGNLDKVITDGLLELIPNVTTVTLFDDLQPHQDNTSNGRTYRGYAEKILSKLPKVNTMVLFSAALKHGNSSSIKQEFPDPRDLPFRNLAYIVFFNSSLEMDFCIEYRKHTLKHPIEEANSTVASSESLPIISHCYLTQKLGPSVKPPFLSSDCYTDLPSIIPRLPEAFYYVPTAMLARAISAASPPEIAHCCHLLRDHIYDFLNHRYASNTVSVLLIFGTDTFWSQYIDLYKDANYRIKLINNLEPVHAIRTILRHPHLTDERFLSLADVLLPDRRLTPRSDLFGSEYSPVILTGLVARDSYAADALIKYLLPEQSLVMSSGQSTEEIAKDIVKKNPLLIQYIKGKHTSRPIRDLLNMMVHHRCNPWYCKLFQILGLCLPLYYDDQYGYWVAMLMIHIAPEESRDFIDTCTRLNWIYLHLFKENKASMELCHLIQSALLVGPPANANTLAADLLLPNNYQRLKQLTVDNIANNILRRVFECLTNLELCTSLREKVDKILIEHFSLNKRQKVKGTKSHQDVPKYLKHLMGIAKSRAFSLRSGLPYVVGRHSSEV